jgi:hypothetical protein
MTEPLRPLSTGQLLDRTFSLYRRNFVLFVTIAAIAPALYLAMQAVLVGTAAATPARGWPGPRQSPSVATTIVPVVVLFVGLLVWMLGLALTHAATIQAVSAVHLGRKTSFREAYGSLKGRYGRIIGVFLSVAIRVFGGAILLMSAAIGLGAGSVAGGRAFGLAGGIAGVIIAVAAAIAAAMLAVTLFVRYALAVQACVVENIKGREALKRSAVLTKGSRSRVLTVYTLFVVLTWVMGAVTGLIALALSAIIPSGIFAAIAIQLASFVAGALTGPLVTIGMSVLYFDERVRKEAFDLQLMMASLDGGGTAAAAASAGPA